MTQSIQERIYQWCAYVIVSLICLASVYPLIYVLSMSLVSDKEWTARGGFVFIPYHPTLLAFKELFAGPFVINALGISILRTALGTLLELTMTALTAYCMSRRDLVGRKLLLFVVLITILFNGGMIPTYLIVKQLNMLNSIWALIVPVLIDSWSVLVLKQFFENIPSEVEDSAKADGVGDWRMMVSIIMPMSKPALAAIGLFIAVFHWNSWFDAFIYINEPKLFPLQLIVRNMFNDTNLVTQFSSGSVIDPELFASSESLKMAVAVTGTIPILLVYPFIQKYFTKGMYLGAVKG